jgi:hypothetical protein
LRRKAQLNLQLLIILYSAVAQVVHQAAVVQVDI